MIPKFPDFKPIEISDREFINNKIWEYRPETSELNFNNFFIWRYYYGFEWSMYEDWLLILTTNDTVGFSFFPPIGPPSRDDVTKLMLEWLREEKSTKRPFIVRADKRLVSEIEKSGWFDITPTRDHFDYIYHADSLSDLAGRKLHSKRNHINKFKRLYDFEYLPISKELVDKCFQLFRKFHNWQECKEDPNSQAECISIHEALMNFEKLKFQGGTINIANRVVAFTIGEKLNSETALIHIEKIDPEIPQLYSVINQQFSEHTWKDVVQFINREQDLGKPGLRQAKSSYYPDHLIEKFQITLSQ